MTTKKTAPFAGTWTALVTPMTAAGHVDEAAMDRLIDRQVAAGIDGVVVHGTTGEATTLSANERRSLLTRVMARAQGRLKVMAGTGGASTHDTIAEQRIAQAAGADAGLVVTPPYSRPGQRGLLAHYRAVAEACELPIVLYDVPARTGSRMDDDTVSALAEIPHIVGYKDATADLSRVGALRAAVAEQFALLSGDDATVCPYILAGGDGVISVVSNCAEAQMVALVKTARAGQVAQAQAAAERLRPLLLALSIDVNPVPIKAALSAQKIGAPVHRLPLVALTDTAAKTLLHELSANGWIEKP